MKKISVLFSVVLLSLVFNKASAQDSQGYDIGDKASDFKLESVDGSWVSLAGLKSAKGAIVIFSCNTCPYVVAYEDRMIDLHNKYAALGYPVIAINPNDDQVSPGDSFEKMKERSQDKRFPFAYVYDRTQEVIKAYGGTRTPHVYILNKEGDDFIVKYIGAIDNNYQDASAVTENYVEEAMDAIMNGRTVATETTKAIGCTIKWSKKTE
ncbi:thioredoxin family protein [Cecembia lonarensis]|uniref:Thiol-disulfide oxidoreductase n=1 Tax=Cecembia lonarensis (strain CCUG 58316 / KCTC 22772 / LW9) TaxID=1225176 RepID=K1L8H1_CECL9|nr:thioredoxin family protein [Cecembia lonarensis]EKB48472.1 thiol-disulfide oxidoreductase [Cecembia lonarensis LW9]